MPQRIKHIDAIARDLKRDVLLVTFGKTSILAPPCDWKICEPRQRLIRSLEALGIAWTPCARFARTDAISAYAGEMFLDVNVDENDASYRAVCDLLEFPDGEPRDPNVILWLVPPALALKNAHRDEAGFWEKWARGW